MTIQRRTAMRRIIAVPCLGLLIAFMPLDTIQAAEQMAFTEIEQQRGLPSRGQTSNTVMKNHGEPTREHIPVGNPPIKSWQYPDFTVYFERNMVITTVTNEDNLPERLQGIAED